MEHLMDDIKAIEKRIILYEATKVSYCAEFGLSPDHFYHVYCHYRLIRIKLDCSIFQSSFKLQQAFNQFIMSIWKL